MVEWAIGSPRDPSAPLRLARVDVYDPDLPPQSERIRRLRRRLRSRISSVGGHVLPQAISVVQATLAAGGVLLAVVIDGLLGQPVGSGMALLGGGGGGLGAFALLRSRSERGWRSVELTNERLRESYTTVIHAHGLATTLAADPEAPASVAVAVGAAEQIAWAIAGVNATAIDSADLRALDPLNAQARELLDGLTRIPLSPPAATIPVAIPQGRARTRLRALVQRDRSLDEAQAAIELARAATDDLDVDTSNR
ncbi:MAG: hypothetical protein LC798_11845 [Chloroflexi bacterium]|nr:hypothetical protein [Chloroflexota bacterium]